jgi:hypothetical protein
VGQARGHLVGGGGVDVGDDDRRSLGVERLGDGAAEALAGAGDDRDPVFEQPGHQSMLAVRPPSRT